MKKLIACLILLSIALPLSAQNCKGVKETKDEFTGEVLYSTPVRKEVAFDLNATKGNVFIYLRTNAPGGSRGTGAILLFENGEKMQFESAKINIHYGEYDMASATIMINRDELTKLATIPLKAYRLYIYDHKIQSPEKVMEYAQCLLNKLNPDAN